MAFRDFKCECGVNFELDTSAFTNVCPNCGAFYNWGGSRLADPSQWGEETGESFSSDGSYVIGSGDQDLDFNNDGSEF